MIVDLSAPEGHSVNDGIEDSLSIEWPVGACLTGVYRDNPEGFSFTSIFPSNVPGPSCRIVLATLSTDMYDSEQRAFSYIDKVLPFGVRSAPLLFTALADATEWVIRQKGVQHIWHYVDDFILAGEPHSTQCASSMASALQAFHELGIPIEPEKSEGPATTLTVLGIEVDTVAMQLRLPADKLCRLQETTASWRGRKCCTKRELLSLIGLLQHAATVTRPGRSFVRSGAVPLQLKPFSRTASDVTSRSGLTAFKGARIDMPFHAAANWNHHSKSDRNSLLRRIWASMCLRDEDRLIIHDPSSYYCEGTHPNCNCSHAVGPQMGRKNSKGFM